MQTRAEGRPPGRNDDAPGFALILSIMALLLLTFLALTLAATTTSELQVSTNYRWSQQALYNAEAGIEAGKWIIKTNGSAWAAMLPGARAGTWTSTGLGPIPPPSAAPWAGPDTWGNPARNFENAGCDTQTGEGNGAVLFDPSGALPGLQNVTSIWGQQLQGSFTLWVRRDVTTVPSGATAGQLQDDPTPNPTTLVMVAEGTAPSTNMDFRTTSVTANFTQANKAVVLLRVALARSSVTAGGCGATKDQAQAGMGPSNSNFAMCFPANSSAVGLVPGPGNHQDTGAH
jgi:hypothetical protein